MRSLHRVCALFSFALAAGCAAPPPPPPLTLTEIAPPLASVGGGLTVRLHGQGYVPGTQVHFGAAAALVQVDSAEQLTVVVPPWTLPQGLVPVSVQRPDGPAVSREDLFTYYKLLGSPETHLTAAAELRAVVAADWNRDGRADVAVATGNPSAVTLLLSQPDGSLVAAHRYDGGTDPTALVVGDA